MACTYVKEFDFKKTAGDMSAAKSGYAKGGTVKAGMHKMPDGKMMKNSAMKSGYAKGGEIMEKATGEKYPSRKAMMKHEKMETPREQREELIQKTDIKGPLNRMAAPRRSVPVAPQGPLIPLKAGGAVPKAGAYKVGKVMGEFGKGELHSGSKSGPTVTNPKQAVAIALSEARQAAKKR